MQQIQSPDHLDDGPLGRASTELVRRLVAAGIDGVGPLPPAARAAAAARARTGSTEEAVDALVASATKAAAVAGFATGVGGFVTLPVALPANVVGFYVVAARTAAGIAALRGYDLTRPEVRTAVLVSLVDADAQPLLTLLGLGTSAGLATRLLSTQLSEPALMVLDKGVAFQVVSKLGSTALSRLGRGLPLAGGLVGAASDAWMLHRTALAARADFPQRPQEQETAP
ncbi:EcsC family protein [Quadrisphaera sp. DSM 44207]|uniref:EcsC family protein n=1 Tax=Quadrisphaera sp. DSM 44207 TaxID=1881057 RepID=UPI0008837EA7|nr:EcsC family protein [Quadrisphaera sp. DSM 44207]SDQ50962.1 EcsC protein family protein [Quadrisphaera sp. DSM 44207]